MPIKEHKDYEIENERLEYTKEYIEKTIDATDTYRDVYKGNIKEAMTELDYLDSSQNYIEIILNTKFMEIAERNYDNLKKVANKPYFARIDFKRQGSDQVETHYIGKVSLIEAEDETPLILDWRSPMADIYYEGRLGEVSYDTETQTESGELLLKRQFMIEEGEIEDILDIDITANDAFLQASLEANVDNKLKDIASTIQAEQNRVIRAPMDRALIVQGAAGSGKTTIALHRIAYFMYKYEKTFDPDTFMVIAPNKLFINYISEVLPELGVENIRQTTFVDLMQDLVGKKHKITEENQVLLDIIEENEDVEMKKWMSSFKGSLEFKDMILRYIDDIEKSYTPEEDFVLEDYTIEKYDILRRSITEDYAMFPLYKRVDKLKKNLREKLKQDKKDILKELEDSYDTRINVLRQKPDYDEETRNQIVSLLEERDSRLEEISKLARTAVNKYAKLYEKKNAIDYYRELMTDSEKLRYYSKNTLSETEADYISEKTKEIISKKKLHLEDYPPLSLIMHKIHGFKEDINIKSVVIDEAQDLSLFQFYVLRNILNTERFTVLGDISQGIHSYRSIDNWEEVISDIFGQERASYKKLVQSYRTTVEIMDYANKLISKLKDEKLTLAEPVIRHGKAPETLDFDDEKALIDKLSQRVEELDREYSSIALICKTYKESKDLSAQLKKRGIETNIIDDKQELFENGISVVPAHLSKGLEFDAVIITSISDDYRETETDIKLLYVGMTRALHELHIYKMKDNMKML